MIEALDKNGEYLMTGRLFKRYEVIKPSDIQTLTQGGVLFKCKLVGQMAQEYEQPVRNLTTDGVRMTIETLFNIDVAVSDFIHLDGKTWLVDRVYISERDVKEKALGLSRLKYANKKTTIYLVEFAQ